MKCLVDKYHFQWYSRIKIDTVNRQFSTIGYMSLVSSNTVITGTSTPIAVSRFARRHRACGASDVLSQTNLPLNLPLNLNLSFRRLGIFCAAGYCLRQLSPQLNTELHYYICRKNSPFEGGQGDVVSNLSTFYPFHELYPHYI